MSAGVLAHTSRVAIAAMVCRMQVAVTYRFNMAVWAMSSLLQVVVYMSIWRAVAEASGGRAAGGYTAAEFAGYFLVLLLVREFTYSWVPWDFPDTVRRGTLSPKLLRPAHPLIEHWGAMSAFKLQSCMMLVPVAIILFLLFDAQGDWSVAALAWAVPIVLLASVGRFFADAMLACVSFWIVRIDGVRGLYYLVLLILGGQFAPLDVLPEQLAAVARMLPFYWMLGFPVELITGHTDVSNAPLGLAILAAWSVVLLLCLRVQWRAGMRRYGAVGA